jgi:hypothetical protein
MGVSTSAASTSTPRYVRAGAEGRADSTAYHESALPGAAMSFLHAIEGVVLPIPDSHDLPTIRLNRLKSDR